MTRKKGIAVLLLAALCLVVALANLASARVDRTGAAREAAAETALSDGGEDATVTPDIMLAQDGTDR